jgi:hypothetical protein
MPRASVIAAVALAVVGCSAAEPTPPATPACPPAPPPAPAATATPAPAPRLPDLEGDEGMWTFDAIPRERLEKLHGFAPSQAWLDHVRASTLRIGRGCTASVVSASGLVMTNHHCAEACLTELSTKKRDLVASGFLAKTPADELRCPGLEAVRLVGIEDVTARVAEATKGAPEAKLARKTKAAYAEIERGCSTAPDVRCEVVSLYHGGLHHLYRYERFDDVRLVFAPEFAIAFFGGDTENFDFPRHDLDVTLFRLWRGGAPAPAKEHLAWAASGPKEGDLTFVAGNPAQTQRLLTVAELAYQRDVALPESIARLSELRGIVASFRARGPEPKRMAHALFFGIENGLKARKGRWQALVDASFFGRKVEEERALRGFVAGDPALAASTGGAWDAIAKAQRDYGAMHAALELVEEGRAFESRLFEHARALVRAAEELPKPNAERLREFGDARRPSLETRLFSPAPIHAELEETTLAWSLGKLREQLGAGHPIVRKVLGRSSPEELARALVKGTKLFDPKARRALFTGGKAAVDASKDPMIELARRVDPDARALRKEHEERVQGVLHAESERIAKAYFAMVGTSRYPDATGTLRLSFGVVKGWVEAGRPVAPFTTFGGAFERDTGSEPFALPKSWLAARPKLRMETPFDLVTTNDIIGGNSGSPLLDREGRVVGLVFDGNLHSLGGAYGYDAATNRATSVDVGALREALDRVYGASSLLGELGR